MLENVFNKYTGIHKQTSHNTSTLNLADESETPTDVVNGVLQGITSFPRLADP